MLSIVIIATVCAVAVAQPSAEVPLPMLRSLISGMALVSVVTVAGLATRLRLATELVEREREHESRVWDAMTQGMWAIMALFSIQVMRFPSLVRMWSGDRLPFVDEGLILVALLLPLFFSWSLLHVPSPHAGWRDRLNDCLAVAWLRMRFAVVLAVVPLFLISAVSDLLSLYAPRLSTSGQTAAYVGALGVMITLFPFAMRMLWQIRSFERTVLQQRLLRLAERHRVTLTGICVWETGYRVANAFVAGIVSQVRYIFLTDGLLSELDDDQVELVFAHELGHVVKRHLLLRMLALVTPISIFFLLAAAITVPRDAASLGTSVAIAAIVEIGATTITLLFLGLGLGWYSRQLEHEADLWACFVGAAGDESQNVAMYEQALARLADPDHSSRNHWLHPGYCQRCRFLREHIGQPQRRRAFGRWMSVLAVGLYVLNGSALLILLHSNWAK